MRIQSSLEVKKMRIGINVPNELLQQVRAIEPRVNISQACREALQGCVDLAKRAEAQANSAGIVEHVNRLVESGDGPLVGPDWVALGIEDAAFWVSTASRAEWDQFIEMQDDFREIGHEETFVVRFWDTRAPNRGLDHHLFVDKRWLAFLFRQRLVAPNGTDSVEEATQTYYRAWLGYVNEVRRRIGQHYKDEYQRVMREREEYRESLPKPEVPSQLI